ncbi:L-threonylcarbamoyladenylate synthase [Tuberibacillus calidus]|uniref:L-threonylcarbamoyladenylate synthase n=1 Tax=Tuberibacillus calidus TaxID=340097 RepID=UPI0003F5F874|nr:L-threonylcarbamoyladenylate synthase [Tuberibacillus calidus]
MLTKIWRVDPTAGNLEENAGIQEAATYIRDGEVIAFPTETVYGLGANALSDNAVKKIYEAKGRPSDNPLIVHISDFQQAERVARSIPDAAEKLMKAFWPGPLTVIVPAADAVAKTVTAGLKTVGLRMPKHPVARALISAAGVPIAAPSANLSGKPSPTEASHVYEDMNGRIAGILDGGPAGVGVESTVVDTTQDLVTILRPGGITREQLEAVLGKVASDPALKDKKAQPKAPGMKYRHYSPKAPVELVSGGLQELKQAVARAKETGLTVGVLTTTENANVFKNLADVISVAGTRADLATVAQGLFHALRRFDHYDLDIIFSETFPAEGIGEAIMNRLNKAAGSSKNDGME